MNEKKKHYLRARLKQVSLRDAIVVVWGLALFTLPFPYRPINAQLIILLTILSIFYFRNREKKDKLKFIRYHLYYLCPFFILIASYIFISTENIKVLEKEAPTLMFPAITFMLLNAGFKFTRSEYKILLVTFAASILMLLTFTYIRSFFYSDEFFAHNFLTFDIIHPSYFSFYCGISILIILELNKNSVQGFKWISYVLIAGILFYMTLLSSRMPLFATVVVLFLYTFLASKTVKKSILHILVFNTFLAGLIFVVYESPRLKYRFIEAFEKNFETRLVSWEASWSIIKEHPIVGVGTGAGQQYLDRFYEIYSEHPRMYLDFNSHNYILHVLLTFGSIGLFFTILFWVEIMKHAIQSGNRLLTLSLVLFLVCSLTEVMVATQKGIVFLFLFNSLNLLYTGGENKIKAT